MTWTDPPASAPQIEATADGAIAAGDPIIVKPDGDVKKVGLAITVLNPPTVSTDKTLVTTNNIITHELFWISSLNKFILGFKNGDSGNDFEVVVGEVTDAGVFTWGSIVQVEAGDMNGEPTFAYDTNSNKLVCVWRDTDSGTKIQSVVGTISGNSISFGTVVTIEATSEAGKCGLCFDSTNNKVVAVWSEVTTGYAKSAVGTVSGTSISWGTAVDVNSENSDGFSAAYDPDTQRVLLAANMQSDNEINSYVGTVSGTSISWGSATQVVAAGHHVGIVYDTENNKAVIGYSISNNTDGVARVGTVTGGGTNSISWGSEVTWWNNGSSASNRIVFDDYTKRVVVQLRKEASGSQYLYIASGGVSGTSISFTNYAQQTSEIVYGNTTTSLCMAQKGQIISASRHGTLDQDTYSWRGLAGTGATDLTTENYVGLAAAAANDNATATVDVSGATNTSQSSLTPGQKYFVQGDGTLGLTADTPKVFAGTAVSATKIIVNDQQPSTPEGGLMHVQGFSAANSAYITFENLTSTDISSYLVRFNGITFTSGPSKIMAQLQFNGTWEQNSEYMTRTKIFELGTTSSQTYSGSSAADHFYLQDQGGHQVNGELHLPMCSLTNNNTDEAIKYVWGTMQASNYRNDFHGRCDSTASRSNQISGIRFRSNKSNDNIGVSGRIDLYKYTY